MWVVQGSGLQIQLNGIDEYVQPIHTGNFLGNDGFHYPMNIKCFDTPHPTVSPTTSPVQKPTIAPT